MLKIRITYNRDNKEELDRAIDKLLNKDGDNKDLEEGDLVRIR